MSKDKKTCYNGIMFKLDKIEDRINQMQVGISRPRQRFMHEFDPEEEICPDEILSDKALLESIEDLCLTSLLEREPEGDA